MLFRINEIWREKISNKHIWLGQRNDSEISCFNASVEEDINGVSFYKGDYFGNLKPEVIFDKFFKIL